MTSAELENVARIGTLKREPPSLPELETLAHTLSIPNATCRVLAKCHEIRNAGEYEGVFDIDEGLVEELLSAATAIRDALLRT